MPFVGRDLTVACVWGCGVRHDKARLGIIAAMAASVSPDAAASRLLDDVDTHGPITEETLTTLRGMFRCLRDRSLMRMLMVLAARSPAIGSAPWFPGVMRETLFVQIDSCPCCMYYPGPRRRGATNLTRRICDALKLLGGKPWLQQHPAAAAHILCSTAAIPSWRTHRMPLIHELVDDGGGDMVVELLHAATTAECMPAVAKAANAKGFYGDNALGVACRRKLPAAVIVALVDAGADPFACNHRRECALDFLLMPPYSDDSAVRELTTSVMRCPQLRAPACAQEVVSETVAESYVTQYGGIGAPPARYAAPVGARQTPEEDSDLLAAATALHERRAAARRAEDEAKSAGDAGAASAVAPAMAPSPDAAGHDPSTVDEARHEVVVLERPLQPARHDFFVDPGTAPRAMSVRSLSSGELAGLVDFTDKDLTDCFDWMDAS